MSKIRNYKSLIIRKFLSPSMRFELREVAAWLQEQINRACLWRWEIAKLAQGDDSPFTIHYLGRKKHRELAKIILGPQKVIDPNQASASQTSRGVLVSELPIPGAICVPKYLRTIVQLGRPIETIMASYDDKLYRSLLKQRTCYHLQQALSPQEIERADREMLYPFARARHGDSALQMSSEMVQKSALERGRLDLVLVKDEVVGCMLGFESIRAGKRYWVADRCGYPETVYSDSKRLGETNSINHHLAIEWAIDNGFDYCDFGFCFARPDDGLLQFKRRRGAMLSRICLRGYGYFHIRLPAGGEAQFLWDTPLFAVEGNNLALHLGLPEGPSDDEFVTRYRQMGFGGISKVYLHCARPPNDQLLAKLRDFYKHQAHQPIVKSIPLFTQP